MLSAFDKCHASIDYITGLQLGHSRSIALLAIEYPSLHCFYEIIIYIVRRFDKKKFRIETDSRRRVPNSKEYFRIRVSGAAGTAGGLWRTFCQGRARRVCAFADTHVKSITTLTRRMATPRPLIDTVVLRNAAKTEANRR